MKNPTIRKRRPRRSNRFLPHALGATGGIAVAAVAFWFFHGQAERVVAGRADALDEKILTVVHQIQSRRVTRVMRAASFAGEHPSIGVLAWLTAAGLRAQGRKSEAWTVAFNSAGAMLLSTTLKAIFQRQRPHQRARHIRLPRSHSFPSGHSLLTAATVPVVVHHLVERRSPVVQILGHTIGGVVIGSVGFSRVYFGVHFPSDVFGGFAAGLGCLGLSSLTHSLFDQEDEAPQLVEAGVASPEENL